MTPQASDRAPAGPPARGGGPPRRRVPIRYIVGAVLAAIVIIIGIAVALVALTRPAHQVGPSRPPQSAAQDVHVCTAANYDAATIRCRRDDGTITATTYATAEVVVTNAENRQPSTPQLAIVVRKQSGSGRWATEGTTTMAAGRSFVAASEKLVDILVTTGVAAVGAGTGAARLPSSAAGTYQIAVSAGSTSFGTATFALRP